MATQDPVVVASSVGADLIVTIVGELDLAAIRHLDSSLASFVDEAPFRRIVVHADGVSFCDSSGLQWLLHLPHRFRATDGFEVVGASAAVKWVFEVAGLSTELAEASSAATFDG